MCFNYMLALLSQQRNKKSHGKQEWKSNAFRMIPLEVVDFEVACMRCMNFILIKTLCAEAA